MEAITMWKNQNGRLVHTADATRVRYKTRISAALVAHLKEMAESHDTHVGYLLEVGYEKLLEENSIVFDKKARPKDRIEFRTTCDEILLEKLKLFAKRHQLNLNDVIEASTVHINPEEAKDADWRYRIE